MTSRSPCQPQPFCDSVCSLVLLHFLSIRTLHVPSKSTAQCVSQLGGRPSVSIHTVVHQWYPREVWADLFLSGTLWGPLTHAAEHKATSCQMRNKAITSGHTGPFSPLTSLPECHPVPKWFFKRRRETLEEKEGFAFIPLSKENWLRPCCSCFVYTILHNIGDFFSKKTGHWRVLSWWNWTRADH